MTWPFESMAPFSYRVIYADPPWQFANWSKKGEWKNANRHYDCMPTEQIAQMPVGHLAMPDSVLVLWATSPMLLDGLAVMTAWGFTYKGMAVWAKRTSTGKSWAFGPGYIMRATIEPLLIGTIGAPSRRDTKAARSVRNLFTDPVSTHSTKPDSVYEAIETLYDGPYLELFARRRRPGWAGWGDEYPSEAVA